jgi:hypothetical protein
VTQIPTVIGLLVCQLAVIEEQTKNVTLVNCFTKLKVERFPSELRRFTVFAALIDGAGDVTLEVVVVRLSDGDRIYERPVRLSFGDRLQEVRFIFRVTDCSFPAAGQYEIQLHADTQALAHHKIRVDV